MCWKFKWLMAGPDDDPVEVSGPDLEKVAFGDLKCKNALIMPKPNKGRTRRTRLIIFAVATGLMLLCAASFWLLPLGTQIRAAGQSGVVGSLARFHLRYVRIFDANGKNRGGDPWIHDALYGYADLPRRPQGDRNAKLVARILIDSGAEIDKPGSDGLTVLMTAVRDYNHRKAKAIRALGADPDARGADKFATQSAASIAQERAKRDTAHYQSLLRCDSDALNQPEYWTAVIRRFAETSADVDLSNCTRLEPSRINELVDEHRAALAGQKMLDALGIE
jgi:hypothetical protein